MYKYYKDVASARLIAYSQANADIPEAELLSSAKDIVAYCAKVSNPQLQTDFSRADKLITYLKNNAHWSPFEMASATLELITTRDIARQVIRHRSFAFQEFSQRYADTSTLDDQFVLREARLQDIKNRQNSIKTEDKALSSWWEHQQRQLIEHSKQLYTSALQAGIAKEQARVVLPEGNTVSKLYMQGSIRSWIHYIDLRSDNGTQLEHMLLANAVAEAINKIWA